MHLLQADDALSPGDPNEKLGELNNVPVTRKDMGTLRPAEWLNDEVINYFFEIMKVCATAQEGGGCLNRVAAASLPHHLSTSPPHHLTTSPPHHLNPPLTTSPPHPLSHLTTSPTRPHNRVL